MLQKLFAELRRRNVFRVAGVYAVIGWLLAQAAVLVEGPLSLPAWFDTFILTVLLIGFPVAMIFAWAFEMTPEGMKLTANVPEGESIAPKTGRKLDFVIIGGLALVAVMIVADRLMPQKAALRAAEATAAGASEASIAVLPFADMSPAGDQEYFSDGISEEILNVLAQIPELKVAGRTSSFSFKGKNEDLRVIGAALGVANILEGSVRKQGDKVRITAQLVKVADGFHLWSETYDRNLTDIFAVQDEISAAIGEALALTMSGRSTTATPAPATHVDPQAYDLYLRARQLLATRNPESMRQSLALFEGVTVLAPGFDQGWSGVARASSLYSFYNGGVDVNFHIGQFTRAAAAALALNPENAEAHSVMAIHAGGRGRDLKAAIEETRLATEYAPNDAEIANFAGDAYRYAADFKNALIWERRALELDPLHPINHVDLGFVYFSMGQCKEAVAEQEVALNLDPGLGQAFNGLTLAFLCLGDIDAAKAASDKYNQIAPDDPFAIDIAIRIAVAEKRDDDARKLLSIMKSRAERGDELYYLVAQEESLLGDYAAAAKSITSALKTADSNWGADIIWFVPEDWPNDPDVQAALNTPELAAVWDIRRKNLAANPRAGAAQ